MVLCVCVCVFVGGDGWAPDAGLMRAAGPVLEKTVDGVTHALFARFMAKEHVELYMQSPERKRIAVDLVIPYYNVFAQARSARNCSRYI